MVFLSTDFQIFTHTDASFASNLDGCSTGAAYFLSPVGDHNSPFLSSAKAQVDVATCPMTAGHKNASSYCCKALVHYRQLSTDLGWKPADSTVMFVDNRTAINLFRAPEVTRKARHVAVQYHYIRQLAARQVISVVHVSSESQRPMCLLNAPLYNRPAQARSSFQQHCMCSSTQPNSINVNRYRLFCNS